MGYKALEQLEAKLEGGELSNADTARVGDIALKYGLGPKVEVHISDMALLENVARAAAEFLDENQFKAFLERVHEFCQSE
jgi:hypothetical protein